MAKVLITGATGLIGKRLTALLLAKKHEVKVLTQQPVHKATKTVAYFNWSPNAGTIDRKAFEGVEAIVHLAGTNIAQGRWTNHRKKEIIDSRIKSAELLYNYLKSAKHSIETYITASAVGYYGDCKAEIIKETHRPGNDFLAEVCKLWEAAATRMTEIGLREVRCRFGIVLAKEGGALPELTRTVPLGISPYFVKSNLYYPWVHIDDVCGIIIHAIENKEVKGAYNTTAPKPLPMKELMQKILEAKDSNALLTPTPPIALRIAMGEMSEMLLGSQRCSAEKIMNAGYKFRFAEIENALKDLC